MEILADIFLITAGKLFHCLRLTSLRLGISEDDIKTSLESMIPAGIFMKKYTDKSFVVRLETENPNMSQALETLGGLYNNRLSGGPGYIFPLWKGKEVREYIMGYRAPKTKRNLKPSGEIIPPRVVSSWSFDVITSKFPYFNMAGVGYSGEKYKMLIPVPKDQNHFQSYENVMKLFERDKYYWPAEALFMVKNLLNGDALSGGLKVDFFTRSNVRGGIYWIQGDADKVKKKVDDLFDEYPFNPYGSSFRIRYGESGEAQAYFYYGSSD